MSPDSAGESPLPYAWHGRGEPLVLIAGLGGKGTRWRPFLARAAERHRVLTFDLRGSGRADPIDGGTTIRALAAEVLERLVLVSTSGRCDPHPPEVFLLWARMAELGVPPEIRHNDRLTPLAHAEALAQAIPGAELEVIPGAGHLPYLESPDRFAERALAFLAAGTSKGEFACRRPTS